MAKQPTNNKAAKTQAKAGNALFTTTLQSTLVGFLIIAASLLYLALIDRPANNNEQINTLSSHLAENQTFLLTQSIEGLQSRLNAYANSAELVAALDSADDKALIAFSQELQRAFPEAISARLIKLGPLGIAALNKQKTQLRNSIEVDIIRRASESDNVAPEAYRFQKQWLVSLIQAVRPEGQNYASGALLITLDNKYINTQLSRLDTAFGQTAVIQQGLKAQTFASSGQTATSDKTLTVDTDFVQWQVSFTPSPLLVDNNSHSNEIIWIILAIAAFASMTATAIVISGIKKGINDNLGMLIEGTDNNFSLPGFTQAADQLQQLRNTLSQAADQAPDKSDQQDRIESAPSEVESESALLNPSELELSPLDTLPIDLPATIFRAYDIRGIADTELNDDACYAIGMAIGSETIDQGQSSVVLAADGRHSSPRIRQAMSQGLQASGCNVIDIGTVPTPLMYFATHQLNTQSGVMITGSHNPAEYNGIKVVIAGKALSGDAISALRDRVHNRQLHTGSGNNQSQAIEQEYMDYILNDVAIAQPLKIVIDAGNGVAGAIAPELFEALGCEVVPLYCDVDGDFPNHHPDPSIESNLDSLIASVKSEQADLGIAFDGDGDRLGVVTAQGNIVAADRLLMLLAQDVVSRNPGADVLFDVKCTRNLNTLISNYGGRPIMWKTGHSFMKEKMQETGALLGGEFSGHIFFKERWFGFDDGMYAAARLIEILSTTDPDLDAQLMNFPNSICTPELKINSDEHQKFAIIEQLAKQGDFGNGKISTLDGVRVDFPDGWGLVRASNTTPMLILRFEADDQEGLGRIQHLFKDQLATIDNSLDFGF